MHMERSLASPMASLLITSSTDASPNSIHANINNRTSSKASCPVETENDTIIAQDTDTDSSLTCRYKTGRCTNARVVKPNGVRLLLCEFHRNQQNRTKKRSDMKYRHDRAYKRMMLRQQRRKLTLSLSLPSNAGATANTLGASCAVQSSRSQTCPSSTVVGTSATAACASNHKLLTPPPSCGSTKAVSFQATPTGTRGLRAAEFALNRRFIHMDFSIDASESSNSSAHGHGCALMSPLRTLTPLRKWHPDEVQLLQYFILG